MIQEHTYTNVYEANLCYFVKYIKRIMLLLIFTR